MSKFLITGGDGFIGCHVARALVRDGHEVVSYDAQRSWVPHDVSLYHGYLNIRVNAIAQDVERVIGDTTDRGKFSEVLETTRPNYVIHLAALPLADTSNKYGGQAKTTILDATEIVLDCIKEHIKINKDFRRFVFASSSMVYGDFKKDEQGNTIPAREDDPLDPRKSMYAAYKAMGELIVRSFSHVYKIPSTIIRPSAVYGPTDSNRRVTEIFVNNALIGRPLRLHNDGRDLFDFTYVTDLAQGIILATLKEEGVNETFNITTGRARMLSELAEIISDRVPGVRTQRVEYKDSFRPQRGTLDISKARRLLGYEPRYDLESGIRDYIYFVVTSGVLKGIPSDVQRILQDKQDENIILHKGREGQALSESPA